jgi:hypothetical protein
VAAQELEFIARTKFAFFAQPCSEKQAAGKYEAYGRLRGCLCQAMGMLGEPTIVPTIVINVADKFVSAGGEKRGKKSTGGYMNRIRRLVVSNVG